MQAIRPWYVFSSSSGETLSKLLDALSADEIAACQGVFCDRECGSGKVAKERLGAKRALVFTKENFEMESASLFATQPNQNALVLLCGFFGILSSAFLNSCPYALVNTHPSLLPAFSGLDKKVHRLATETVAVTGFTVHLVSEIVDGGAILFQHPVWVDPLKSWEELRLDVRAAEQHYLPILWSQLLRSSLSKKDLLGQSKELRARLGLLKAAFENLN